MNDKELELLNEILSTYKYDDPEMVMEDYEFLKTLNDYVIENTHEFNKEPVYLNRVGINNSYKYSYNFQSFHHLLVILSYLLNNNFYLFLF